MNDPDLERFMCHTNSSFAVRHNEACEHPQKLERAIVAFCRALNDYARTHLLRYGSPIGEDGVLGQDWEVMARALIGLLNGETGRLDCGTLDKAIRAMAKDAEVNLDE